MGSTRIRAIRVLCFKIDEDTNGFIDEVYKVLAIIRVSSIENAELVAYSLKDVSKLSEQWNNSRPFRVGCI